MAFGGPLMQLLDDDISQLANGYAFRNAEALRNPVDRLLDLSSLEYALYVGLADAVIHYPNICFECAVTFRWFTPAQ